MCASCKWAYPNPCLWSCSPCWLFHILLCVLKSKDRFNYVIWFISYMGSVCRGKNFSTSETSINYLPLNPNRTVKLCLLCFRGSKLLNLCQILTVIQGMDGDFLDVENLQMGEEVKQSYTCVLLSGWGWLNLAEPQNRRVVWADRAWKNKSPIDFSQVLTVRTDPKALASTFTGASNSQVLGLWNFTSSATDFLYKKTQ